jgi:3-oxoacyl-[acyl-carrier protein] reductase
VGLLEAKVAVVTGGAQGIGLAIATAFTEQGARVIIGDIDRERAEASAAELRDAGADVTAQSCDVTSESDMEALVALAVERHGSLDIMVNNAGITRDATMRKMTVEDFKTVIEVHLFGAWLGTRLASAVMREQGSGSIINISSISGKVGNPGQTNYSAAKAGIVGMTKAAAKELAHLGVRVNAIQPGLIRTAMTEKMRADLWEQRLSDIPMGRAGEPSDVAGVAVFLASGLSAYMTGTVLEVTGGRHI